MVSATVDSMMMRKTCQGNIYSSIGKQFTSLFLFQNIYSYLMTMNGSDILKEKQRSDLFSNGRIHVSQTSLPHIVSRCRDHECFDLPSWRDFILFSDDFYSEFGSLFILNHVLILILILIWTANWFLPNLIQKKFTWKFKFPRLHKKQKKIQN